MSEKYRVLVGGITPDILKFSNVNVINTPNSSNCIDRRFVKPRQLVRGLFQIDTYGRGKSFMTTDLGDSYIVINKEPNKSRFFGPFHFIRECLTC